VNESGDPRNTDRFAKSLETYLSDLRFSDATETHVSATGTICIDFRGFDGHFPDAPVLAGAFQLEMLALLASLLVPPGWSIRTIEHARFRRMLRPGDEVEIEASTAGSSAQEVSVKAILSVDAGRACQTRFTFKPR
jgi:3-hydroxyacyl-[acyl-carrier-protein] dehydratase